MTEPQIRYLSLGWGVQSWTIAAMIALGDLPPIDLAIHSDTGHEATGTYEHARLWTPWLGERGVKVVTVHPERNHLLQANSGGKAQYSVYPPAFTVRVANGEAGQIKRQCTDNWKVRPINRYLRSLLPGQRTRPGIIECWQGISLDEYHRMRTSTRQYITNVYPLVDRRMTRAACIQWLQERSLPVPPKSACVFCPFHSIEHWRQLKRNGGSDWDRATEADALIRTAREHEGFLLYMHPSRKPLIDAVTLPEDEGASQLELDLPCDGGVCFV